MKSIFFSMLFLAGFHAVHAQNSYPATGSVGIGTTSPTAPLQVVSSNDQQALFNTPSANNTWITIANTHGQLNLGVGSVLMHPYIYSSTGSLYIGADNANPTLFVNGMVGGNVGIGTVSPAAPLHVVSNVDQIAVFNASNSNNSWINVSNNYGQLHLGIGSVTPHPYIWSSTGSLFIGGDGSPTVFINENSGAVGIGTTNMGTSKLAVEGTIAARKVVVTLSNPFPDYVFRPDYPLPSLAAVAGYIHAHRHLPEIAPADSMAKSGLDLEQNQVILLKKIEELTLYVIQQDKRSKAQARRLVLLTKELHKQQLQLEAINGHTGN